VREHDVLMNDVEFCLADTISVILDPKTRREKRSRENERGNEAIFVLCCFLVVFVAILVWRKKLEWRLNRQRCCVR
jgi:hypothetical protein